MKRVLSKMKNLKIIACAQQLGFSDVIIEAFFFFFIFHNYFLVLKINYFRKLTFQCKYDSYLRIGQLGNDGKNGRDTSDVV